MYRLSGVVSALPRSAASAVTQRVGLGQQLGLDGAVQRGQLHDRPRHRGELFGRLGIGDRLRRVGVSGFDVQRRGMLRRRRRRCTRARRSTTHPPGSAPTARRRGSAADGSVAENTSANAAGIQLQVGVAEVAGHPSRRQAGAREHLEAEIGGGAARSGDPVGAVAADHRQQVSAVGVGAADHPGGRAHVEEPRPLRRRPRRSAPSTAGHPGDDAQSLQQLAFVHRVVGHRLGRRRPASAARIARLRASSAPSRCQSSPW